MRQKALSIGLASIVLLATSASVLAQSSNNTERTDLTRDEIIKMREEARQQARDQITADREARITERCQAAQDKIQGILSRATEFKNTHAGLYDAWKEKIDSFLERLEANTDIDASELESNLATLDGLVEAAQAAVADYEAELNKLVGMDCVADPQTFQDSLEIARELRSTAVSAVDSVREYIRTTIKADIESIKEMLLESSDEEGA